MEIYKLGGKKKVNLPSGWHDIPYWKGVKILTSEMSETEMMAFLSDTNVEDIRASTDHDTIYYLMNAFTFLGSLPGTLGKFPASVKMGEDRIIFPFVFGMDKYDLGLAELGQVEDMQAIIRERSKEIIMGEERNLTDLELVSICPYVVAIYLQKFIPHNKLVYKGHEALRLVNRVKEEMSFQDVVSMGYFFLSRLVHYKNGQRKGWQKPLTIKQRLWRALSSSIKLLGSMRLLIMFRLTQWSRKTN